MSSYKITLTEEQLRVVRVALEEYFRLRMGQDFEFSNDLAAMDCDPYNTEDPNHDRVFDLYIARRDHLHELMNACFRIAFEPYGHPQKKTDDMLIAEDIWDAIRVKQGISRWGSVLHVSREPVPEIEVTEC